MLALTHGPCNGEEKCEERFPIHSRSVPVNSILLIQIRDLPLSTSDNPVINSENGGHRAEKHFAFVSLR